MHTILTTDQVEERERFAYWREIIFDVFVQLDASQLFRQPFTGRIETGSLGDIQISEVSADPQCVVRSNCQIAKSKEDYLLVNLQTSGQGYIGQDRREANLQQGDFVLYDSTRPFTMHFEQPFRQIVFQFPRSLMLARCGQAKGITSVRIPGTQNPVGALVSTFLNSVASSYLYLDPVTRAQVAEISLDLLAVAPSTVSNAKLNEPSSMANVYRSGARTFISARLADPSLAPSLVATPPCLRQKMKRARFTAYQKARIAKLGGLYLPL